MQGSDSAAGGTWTITWAGTSEAIYPLVAGLCLRSRLAGARGGLVAGEKFGLAPPAVQQGIFQPLARTAVVARRSSVSAAPYALVEPAALCLSGLAVVLGMLAFVSLARSLARPWAVAVATALTFLGTPVWHYGRTLFTEPYALACVLGAYALFIGKQRALLPGLLLGLAVLMKGTYLLLTVPIGVALLWRRDWKRLLSLCAPVIVALAATWR